MTSQQPPSILEKSFGAIILGWWLKHASNNLSLYCTYSELNEYLKEWRNQHFYMVPSAKPTYTSSSRRDQVKVNHGNPLVQIYVWFPHLPRKSPWNPGSCCTSPHQKWHVHQKKHHKHPSPIIASKPRHIWLSSQLFEQRLVFFLSQDGIAWNQAILVKGLLHFRWTMGC